MQVVAAGVGAVSIRDLRAASTAGCPVFAFNAKPDSGAKRHVNTTKGHKQHVHSSIVTADTVQGVLDAIEAFHGRETNRQLQALDRRRQ